MIQLAHLYENRDLAVTTDFRDVFAEILVKRIGITNLARPRFLATMWARRRRLSIIVA